MKTRATQKDIARMKQVKFCCFKTKNGNTQKFHIVLYDLMKHILLLHEEVRKLKTELKRVKQTPRK